MPTATTMRTRRNSTSSFRRGRRRKSRANQRNLVGLSALDRGPAISRASACRICRPNSWHPVAAVREDDDAELLLRDKADIGRGIVQAAVLVDDREIAAGDDHARACVKCGLTLKTPCWANAIAASIGRWSGSSSRLALRKVAMSCGEEGHPGRRRPRRKRPARRRDGRAGVLWVDSPAPRG